MTDPYLLLTPVLALAVLALARFVGCLLKPEFAGPQELPFVESYTLGMPRTDFTGWVGMVIRTRDKELTVTQLGRIMLTQSTAEHQMKIVQAAGISGGVDLGTVTIPISAATTGFKYAVLQPPVVLNPDTDYYVLSFEVANGDAFFELDPPLNTTDVAEVTGSVFDFGDDVPDAGYQRGPGTPFGPLDFKYLEPA